MTFWFLFLVTKSPTLQILTPDSIVKFGRSTENHCMAPVTPLKTIIVEHSLLLRTQKRFKPYMQLRQYSAALFDLAHCPGRHLIGAMKKVYILENFFLLYDMLTICVVKLLLPATKIYVCFEKEKTGECRVECSGILSSSDLPDKDNFLHNVEYQLP